MNKRFSKIILGIIIVAQLAVPVTMLSVYSVKKKEFDENYKEIKLVVDSVACEEECFEVCSDALERLYDAEYIAFEEGENGYYNCVEVSDKPQNEIYITKNSNNGSSLGYFEFGKHNMPEGYDYYDTGYYFLYDAKTELENITNGNCQGPQTEAYMIVRVYKGELEIKEVYIDGIPVCEFYEKAQRGEADVERYDYFYKDYHDEIYEYYDEELDEYLTEPVEA